MVKIILHAVCENDNQEAKCNDTGLKRKNWLENISPLIKRVRVDRSYSHVFSQGMCSITGVSQSLLSNSHVNISMDD